MQSKVLFILLAVSLILFAGCKSEEPPQTKKSESSKAPAFTLNNYDGKNVSLSDYNGKIVVIEWTNYECPFVKYHYEGKKTMIDLANKYKEKGVIWLAINSTSHQETNKNNEFAQKHNIPYKILDDRSGKVGRAYSASRTPEMYILNTNGEFAYKGAIDNAPMGKTEGAVINYVDKALEELTNKKEVSNKETKPYGCTVKYAQ